jgi:hypothetical protein
MRSLNSFPEAYAWGYHLAAPRGLLTYATPWHAMALIRKLIGADK